MSARKLQHWTDLWDPDERPFDSEMPGVIPMPAAGAARGYRMLRDEEVPQLLELHSRVWGEGIGSSLERRWSWMQRNPHRAPGERTIPAYFRGTKLRAYQINVPQGFLVRGEPWRAYLVGSLTADPDAPGGAARLHAYVRDHHPITLWGWASWAVPLYHRTLGKMEFRRFPEVSRVSTPTDMPVSHATRPAYFYWSEPGPLVRPLRADPYLPVRPLASLANLAARAVDGVFLHRRGDTRVREVERFPASLDPWISAASKTHTFILDRNTRYLNWRFAECPFTQYRRFIVEHGPDNPIALFVAENIPDPRGHDAWEISDLLTARDRSDHISAALRMALRIARASGARSVRARNPEYEEHLRAYTALGFRSRGDDDRKIIFWRPPQILEPEVIAKRSSWPISWADPDARLV